MKVAAIMACCWFCTIVETRRPEPECHEQEQQRQHEQQRKVPRSGTPKPKTTPTAGSRPPDEPISAKGASLPTSSCQGRIGVTISCSTVPPLAFPDDRRRRQHDREEQHDDADEHRHHVERLLRSGLYRRRAGTRSIAPAGRQRGPAARRREAWTSAAKLGHQRPGVAEGDTGGRRRRSRPYDQLEGGRGGRRRGAGRSPADDQAELRPREVTSQRSTCSARSSLPTISK